MDVNVWISLAIGIASLVGSVLIVGMAVGAMREQIISLRELVTSLGRKIDALENKVGAAKLDALELRVLHVEQSLAAEAQAAVTLRGELASVRLELARALGLDGTGPIRRPLPNLPER